MLARWPGSFVSPTPQVGKARAGSARARERLLARRAGPGPVIAEGAHHHEPASAGHAGAPRSRPQRIRLLSELARDIAIGSAGAADLRP